MEREMKWRGLMVLMVCVAPLVATAQTGVNVPPSGSYVPRLGDIMNAVQTRHMKLWFTGKSANWDLAAYELRQLKAGLVEAALLYEGIPVNNVTTMAQPVQSVADAIEAKDGKKFAKVYGDLTSGCNACHQSIGRGYIIMRLPDASPFSDQQFAPQGKP
jgi:cytochrome c